MDYLKWSQEYRDEAEKLKRNIETLKRKQHTVPIDQRQTVAENIIRLRMIYYECVETANYLSERADRVYKENVSVA